MIKLIAKLERQLLNLLQEYPGGIKEYDLLVLLDAQGEPLFPDYRQNNLTLFKSHFLLFHTLYRLREQLWREQRYHLHIHSLDIRLADYHPGNTGLCSKDSLRDYYLNLDNLFKTDAAAVDDMINDFWLQLSGLDKRREALTVLQLIDPVDDLTIRRQYRKLVMQHHPDRGGDGARIKELNIAMDILGR